MISNKMLQINVNLKFILKGVPRLMVVINLKFLNFNSKVSDTFGIFGEFYFRMLNVMPFEN